MFDEGNLHNQAGRHELAAASFSLALSKGHSPALAHLSWLLLFGGVGVSQDRDRAFKLLRSRKVIECCHCQGCLSCCYAEGWGAPKNPKRAFLLAQKSAAGGSAFGLHMMGSFHENGHGVTAVNRPLALSFYKQAAALGLAAAQNNAGFMCSQGEGVPHDASEAVRLYKLAAAQADCDAQYNLACMLEVGRGAPRDVGQSLTLLHQAAEQGHRSALYDLAYTYHHGLSVSRNYVKAVQLYRRAAALGVPLANNNLAFM